MPATRGDEGRGPAWVAEPRRLTAEVHRQHGGQHEHEERRTAGREEHPPLGRLGAARRVPERGRDAFADQERQGEGRHQSEHRPPRASHAHR